MNKIIVKKKQGIYVLPIEDIVYMEKDMRRIRLYTADQVIEFYGRFSELVPLLDERFMYCHRSYVINMDQIVWMSCNLICVTNNQKIPFGRDAYGRARKIFTRYMMEKYPERHWDVRKWL